MLNSPDRRPWLFLLSALVIIADRLSKNCDRPPHPSRLRHPHHPRRLPSLACHQHRRGLLAAGKPPPNAVRIGLISFSVFAAVIVFFLLWQTGRTLTCTSVALALILGGALGNLYDRIRLHHVVDFLAVRIYHYNWPDFNVADSCIVIGACLLLSKSSAPSNS